MGVFTLFIILFAQVLPYTEIFSSEFSQLVDFEDADSDEKDSKEESEEKYSQDHTYNTLAISTKFKKDFYFLHGLPQEPVLETFCPPPDWV